MNIAVAQDAEERAGSPARTRKCIVSGDILPESRLVRFVVDPESRVVADVEAKLPGRGMWVRCDRASIVRAVEKHIFSKAAKGSVEASPDLVGTTERLLAGRMLAQLGLAHRAGQALFGFDTIERALRSDKPPALIVQADDAAADGSRKLQAAAVASGLVPFVIGCFSNADLSLALGRANVVHAALKPGRMAERLIFDAGRLSGFRPLKPWIWIGFSQVPRG
jgi:predicted RNA-binding protein YlxR (DUF448 family)